VELTSLIAAARDQGPVVWAAVAAIALGLTLILVALWQRRPRRQAATPPPPAVAAPTTAAATAAADAYAAAAPAAGDPAAGFARPAAARFADPDELAEQSLALMLRRLQAAGDRLEELAADLGHETAARGESVLKDTLQDVEYVFKACGP